MQKLLLKLLESLFMGSFLMLAFASWNTVLSQTVTSDKRDYAPGESAIITGEGWTEDQFVELHFAEDPFVDQNHDFHDIAVSADGTFRVEFPILERHLGVTFTLTAEGKQTEITAVHIFTDAGTATVQSLSPTRNAKTVVLSSDVAVTLDQNWAVNFFAERALAVWSQQAGGKKAGTNTVSGATNTFNPTTDFKPGETVFATVAGQSGLAKNHVYQFTTAVSPTSGIFSASTDVAVGTGPYSVAAADVDGDGDLDILVANAGSNTVSVRRNDGSGTFGGSTDVAVGARPLSVAAADVDGDGDLDILTANNTGNTVSVRLNDGLGNFGGSTNVAVGTGPYSVAAADVDGDGDLDILTANSNSNTVSVRLNDGAGTFGGSTEVAVGSGPSSVAAADVDGDGDLDILTANGLDNTVSLRLNDGSGTFGGSTDVAVGARPLSVAAADVDGDGDLDILVANAGRNTVSVRLNDGAGAFGGSTNVAVGESPGSVAAADVDGDGDVDILTANYSSNTVSVRLNQIVTVVSIANATATYGDAVVTIEATVTPIPSGGSPDGGSVSFELKDYPTSGTNTVIGSATKGADNKFTLAYDLNLLNVGSYTIISTFSGAGTYTTSTNSTGTLTVLAGTATVQSLSPTRNAKTVVLSSDVAVTLDQNWADGPLAGNALTVWSQQAGGKKAGTNTVSGATNTFNPTTDFKPGETVLVTVTVASSLAKNHVYQFTTAASPAPGIFSGSTEVAVGFNPRSVVAADVDGDGDLDILTANDARSVSVRLNDGFGAFGGSTNVAVGARSRSVVAADVDGDGDLDILTANSLDNTVSLRLNDGSGAFSGSTDVSVGTSPFSVAAADVDGDGDLDILTANFYSNTVSVLFNNGSGIFGGRIDVAVGSFPYSVAAADVDGDGDLDILTANFNSNTVSVRLNNGSGTFGGSTEVAVGATPYNVAAADVDGDGDLDILTANNNGNTVSVRLNDGSGAFGGSTEVAVGFNPRSVVAADVDGDGDLDILVANAGSNTVSVRLNDGSGNFGGSTNVAVGESPVSVVAADVDGDGDVDILTANRSSNTVSVRLNQDVSVATVTSIANATATYGDAAVTIQATVTPTPSGGSPDGGSVSFELKDYPTSGTNTFMGSANIGADNKFTLVYDPHLLNVGTYTIISTFSGAGPNSTGSLYTTSTNSTGTLVINKAASVTTVTITGAPLTYTGSAQTPATVSVTGAGGVVLLTPAAVYANNTDAGTATASYIYAGDANHEGSSNSEDFTIGKAASITTVTITGASFTFTGSVITPATVSVTGAGGLDLTPMADYVNNINAGTATASYSYAETANYFASSDSEDFAIGKAATTTVVTINGGPFTYTGSAQTPATVSVTGAGGVVLLTPAAVYADNINAGTANASFSYAGDANHEGSSDSEDFTIVKAAANITATGYSGVYDAAAHGATGTALGVEGEKLSGLNIGASFTNVPGGTANWTFTGGTNYNNQSGTAAIVIGKASTTISIQNSLADCEGNNVTLTATVKTDDIGIQSDVNSLGGVVTFKNGGTIIGTVNASSVTGGIFSGTFSISLPLGNAYNILGEFVPNSGNLSGTQTQTNAPLTVFEAFISSSIAKNANGNVVIFDGAASSLGLPSSTLLTATYQPWSYPGVAYNWYSGNVGGTFSLISGAANSTYQVLANGDFVKEYMVELIVNGNCVGNTVFSKIISVEASCGKEGQNKVQVCQINPNGKRKTLCVSANAVDALLAGSPESYVGSCNVTYSMYEEPELITVPWNTPLEVINDKISTQSENWFEHKKMKLNVSAESYNPLSAGFYKLKVDLEENEWFEHEEPINVMVLVADKSLATDIRLSNSIMFRSIKNGSVIGDLRTIDPVDDQHTYSIAEQSDFELVGQSLIWRGTGIPSTARITVFSTDRAGQTIDRVIELSREPNFGDFKMYPNPAHAEVNLEVELDQSATVGIRIFDAVGRLVYQEEGFQSGNLTHKINIDDLSSGLYTVQVITGKVVMNKVLIKK